MHNKHNSGTPYRIQWDIITHQKAFSLGWFVSTVSIKQANGKRPWIAPYPPQDAQTILSIASHIKRTQARDPSFVSRFICKPFGLGDGRLIEG